MTKGSGIEGPDRCQLGKYLYMCRIKVLDADMFPDNYIGEAVVSGAADKISKITLIRHYFYFCMTLPGVPKRSIYTIVIAQLHNCYIVREVFVASHSCEIVLP